MVDLKEEGLVRVVSHGRWRMLRSLARQKKKKIKSKKESKKYFGSTVNVYGNVNKELKKRIELSRMRGRDGRYTW